MKWLSSDFLFRASYSGALLFFLFLGWALVSAQAVYPTAGPSTSPGLSPSSSEWKPSATSSSRSTTQPSPNYKAKWDDLESLFENIITESEASGTDSAALLSRLEELQIEVRDLKLSGALASQRYEILEQSTTKVIVSLRVDLETALDNKIAEVRARMETEMRLERMTRQALTFKIVAASEAALIILALLAFLF